MKINKIILNNIGPYYGENTISFVGDLNRNITLIGGKNGAGKTTLFNSIKVGMYGYKSFGFDSVGIRYNQEIIKMINSKAKSQLKTDASILIDLIIEDGKEDANYILIRSWNETKNGVKEKFVLTRNNIIQTSDEIAEFNRYLDGLVSAELFNFFFFDGEKISDYFLSDDKDKNFKTSFLRLCGLDSINILVDNLERVYNSNNKNKIEVDEFTSSRLKLRELLDKEIEINSNIIAFNNKISIINEKETSYDLEYKNKGGLKQEEWKSLNSLILNEEQVRQNIYKEMKDVSLNILPFLIIKDQINELSIILDREESEMEVKNINEKIGDPTLKKVLKEKFGDDLIVDRIIVDIIEYFKSDSKGNILLGLSNAESEIVKSTIRKIAGYDKMNIEKFYKGISNSLKVSTRIKSKLSKSGLNDIDDYYDVKDSLNIERNNMQKEINLCLVSLSNLQKEIIIADKKYMDAKKKYEEQLKKKSVTDVAGRALIAYKDMSKKLIDYYKEKLEIEFIKNFNLIINKDKFINGIDIDNNLNVQAYKDMQFKLNGLEIMVKEKSIEFVVKHFNIRNKKYLEEVIGTGAEYVTLPIIIKTPFSQGEKQVFIMSIYISMLQISNIKFPFIIDTPFARIDSSHRKNIVQHFFKKLDSQLIILSTDEEIVGEYIDDMHDKIGNKLILESITHGTTVVKNDSYFDRR